MARCFLLDSNKQQGNRRYQTSPAVCNPTPTPPPSRPTIDSCNACNQASAPILCMPLHAPVQFEFIWVLGLSVTCPPKLPLSLRGSSLPCNTLFLGPSPLINSNGISIGSAVFILVPNAMLYNALSMGKNSQNCHSLGFRYPAGGRPSHGHIDNMQNWSRSRVWFWRYPRGQRDRHTYRRTHHNTPQLHPRAN